MSKIIAFLIGFCAVFFGGLASAQTVPCAQILAENRVKQIVSEHEHTVNGIDSMVYALKQCPEYTHIGEVLARVPDFGEYPMRRVIDMWVASPTHYAIITDKIYKHSYITFVRQQNVLWAVGIFTN
jgi:hypothetical protein